MKLTRLLLIACAALALFTVFAGEPAATEIVTLAGAGLYVAGDANLKQAKALTNGAGNVTTDPIDLGHTTSTGGRNTTVSEFVIAAPALTVAALPNGGTVTYEVLTSDSADMSDPTTVNAEQFVQTGADGAGAAADESRFRLPTDCQRYVAVKATKSGTGDASTVEFELSLKF